MPRRPRVQECVKRLAGRCLFCDCSDYEALQCHRIVPGKDGGEYDRDHRNLLVLCANHHAMVTAGTIEVIARRYGSGGSYIQCVLGGKEQFIGEKM